MIFLYLFTLFFCYFLFVHAYHRATRRLHFIACAVLLLFFAQMKIIQFFPVMLVGLSRAYIYNRNVDKRSSSITFRVHENAPFVRSYIFNLLADFKLFSHDFFFLLTLVFSHHHRQLYNSSVPYSEGEKMK